MSAIRKLTSLTAEDHEAISHLLDTKADVLTTWELDFLQSIQDRTMLTERQRIRFEELWADVVKHRRRD